MLHYKCPGICRKLCYGLYYFLKMVGWASVCAVIWRSPCALRLSLHSFPLKTVCVYRNSRNCDCCLLVADSHVIHSSISVLFRIIGLFIPEILQNEIKKTALVRTNERDKKVYFVLSSITTRGPDSSHLDRIYTRVPVSPNILFMNLGGLC
jgi:hypothetical protein